MKNTITLIILFISLLSSQQGLTQAIPQFQTIIYVEDAVGNRDSVVVGFDTLATTGIDAIFGEEEITAPFDSVLDVRIASMDFPDRLNTLKVDIEPSELVYPLAVSHGCYNGFRSFIYIWAKHQPVTVTWDKDQFLNDICIRGSLLSNHWADEVTDPYDWEALPQNAYYCMGALDSWTIDISESAITLAEVNRPVTIEKEVEGMGIQTIYGLRFFPSPTFTFWTPCYYITDTEETPLEVRDGIELFPNPAHDFLRLNVRAEGSVQTVLIWSIQGQLLKVCDVADGKIDLTSLVQGIYVLTIETDDGSVYNKRVVKM